MSKEWKSYKDVKIACYAISAGEPKEFIDRWLESMKPADYICVLITKEGDPKLYYFNEKQEEYPNLTVSQKTIKPWRFDVARNESLKLVPKDSDALICTDIDETLLPDFWEDYRKCVFEHPNFDRIFYKYAWSHDDNGNPKWTFWYDKTHQLEGWRWDYPVHEALVCDKKELYNGCYYLDSNKIYLHHYPDNTKSRGSYLGLLKQRAEEYPNDLYGLYYLAREYSFIRDHEHTLTTAIQLFSRLLKTTQNINEVRARDDMNMLGGVCNMIGDAFYNLGIKEEAEHYYKLSIRYARIVRDGYIKLAQLYAYSNKPQECYKVIDEMHQNVQDIEDWRNATYYSKPWKELQIIADAKCWEGKYKEAIELFNRAESTITTADDKQDATYEGFFGDKQFAIDAYEKSKKFEVIKEENILNDEVL